jgi:hypothetical protein
MRLDGQGRKIAKESARHLDGSAGRGKIAVFI